MLRDRKIFSHALLLGALSLETNKAFYVFSREDIMLQDFQFEPSTHKRKNNGFHLYKLDDKQLELLETRYFPGLNHWESKILSSLDKVSLKKQIHKVSLKITSIVTFEENYVRGSSMM